jgi:hypothetical protein
VTPYEDHIIRICRKLDIDIPHDRAVQFGVEIFAAYSCYLADGGKTLRSMESGRPLVSTEQRGVHWSGSKKRLR